MTASDATFIPGEHVREGFQEGGLLFDADTYQVYTCRREVPGAVEIHEHAIDVMYGVDGHARVIVGGELVDAREVAPGEVRAAAVEGGSSHEFGKDDVLAVPSGVPHQFAAVSDSIVYFVVKIWMRSVPAETRSAP